MLTQEEYMDVLKLRHAGFTITEIAEELSCQPAAVSRWIAAGGPPPERETDRSELLIDEHWARRIEMLLERTLVCSRRASSRFRDRGIHWQLSDGLVTCGRFAAGAFAGLGRPPCRSSLRPATRSYVEGHIVLLLPVAGCRAALVPQIAPPPLQSSRR